MTTRRRMTARAAAVWTLSLATLAAAAHTVLADAQGPTPKDAEIAKLVCDLLERGHVTRVRIDDTMSQRLHKAILRYFDPLKIYFLQSDVDEFSGWERQHDEQLAQGNTQFVFEAYKRFLTRLDQRVAWAKEFANAPYDFNKAEKIVVDPDTATYAKSEAESKERWRVRVGYELDLLMADGKSEKEARERIQKRYRNVSNIWHKTDENELVEMFLSSLTTSFDPHSSYMSPNTLQDFQIGIQLSLEGIGAILQSEDGSTIVKEVVPGGAADRDGRLKPGDKIVAVGEGDKGDVIDIADMKLRQVVKHTRGKAGTVVRLEVQPANAQKTVVYALTRQKIELEDGEAKGQIIDVPAEGGAPPRKIGVIKLPSFYADNDALRVGAADAKTATNDVRRILEDFNRKGVEGVVMDLRTNGGGLLNEAIELTGLFIDRGPVVQAKDYSGEIAKHNDPIPGVVYRGPLVVLVSKFSASASEIFAGAIQDYRRGVIVGDASTHGKGSVQKVIELSRIGRLSDGGNPGAVKLTMQKFYRVNGQSTQNRGVQSDVVLPSPTDHEDFGEAKLDYALEFDTIPPAGYERMNLVDDKLISELRQLSANRFSVDPELKKLVDRKDRVTARRSRKAIEFTLASLKKEHDEIGKDKEAGDDDDDDGDVKPVERTGKKKDKPFGSDSYTKEVVHIVTDYLRLKDAAVTAR